jgi:hypothetical protein
MDDDATPRRESPYERLDRNMNELLQELRVAQTGVQLLFAFLLTLTFQSRFTLLDSFGRGAYLASLALALLASGFLIAPVGYHRMLFRRRMKDQVVAVANAFALVGMACLALSLGAALMVILDVLYSRGVALLFGVVATGFLLVLWFLLPLLRLRAERHNGDANDGSVQPLDGAGGVS